MKIKRLYASKGVFGFMLFLVGSLIAYSAPAFAADPVKNVQCILGQPGAPKGLNCTANDILLSSPIVTVVEACDYPGDTATVEVIADITGTAKTRYDIGVWVSVDGDPNGDGAESGICTVVSIPNDIFDTNGNSVNIDGDNCGDVANTGNLTDINQADLGSFDVLCLDTDGDGNLNLPLIISWDNQPGSFCSVSSDALPGTAAKCNAELDSNIPVPVPARLYVNKTTTGGDTTSFDFTLTGTDSGIEGGFVSPYDFQLAPAAVTGGLLAGAYVLSESATSGWLSSGSCTSDLDGANTDPASLNLRAGETVTCNFSNTPDTGTLRIVKQSVGDTGSFSFSGSGSIGNFALDTSSTNPNQTDFVVTSGSYDVTETIPAGWVLSSATCSGGTGTPNLETGAITGISVTGGSLITCTFVNAAAGSVTVNKFTQGGDGKFSFTSTFEGEATFDIETTEGSGTKGGITDDPDDYTITETVPAGWEFISAECRDEDGVTSAPNGNGVTVTVSEGATVICDFTNRKLGTIIVEKETDPPAVEVDFEFTGDASGTIGGGESITVLNRTPGEYDATEIVPEGWMLSDISCDDDNSTGDTASAKATFNVEAGETVTCTFTNTKLATITVEKVLDGEVTDELTSFAFTSSFDEPFNLDPVNTPASDTFEDIEPDVAHSVTETLPTTEGWSLLSATCGGGGETVNLGTGQISNIVPDAGENVTCTFTNELIDAPPTTFLVTKEFTDGNPASVEVRLTCNSGLDLIQQQTIHKDKPVKFVVTAFEPGEMNCRVEEIAAPGGYIPTFLADEIEAEFGSIRSEEDGCYYDEVGGGEFICAITNAPAPQEVVVYKEWREDTGEADSTVFMLATAEYTCYDVLNAPDGTPTNRNGTLQFSGNSHDTIENLYPYWGSVSYCEIYEVMVESIVDYDDSDCERVVIALGSSASCTIYNTVFFEGIPSLNQFGLMILALLMLGVGAIGFRRHA
jgi:hypothetical protein